MAQLAELQVLGPEVVAPLRDAVGLVDGEQRQRRAVEQTEHPLGHQPLRRDVEQVELAGEQVHARSPPPRAARASN